ncbi:MAG TPA: efflux transporter outer membrane subunit [Steroidobacteraceae bacterium]|jgi:multidrug efflux system outer membrane protein|nr:efflux transporter outer membrane subunit [Steroidobacteraceae bacterium]
MKRGVRRPIGWLRWLCCGLIASGCSVGPNFVRPQARTPEHWSAASAPAAAPRASHLSEDGQLAERWWLQFNDTGMQSLIERALKANLDLRIAMQRVEEARAQRDVTGAQAWPRLSVGASYTRARLSQTTPTGSLFSSVGQISLPGGAHVNVPLSYNQFQTDADASWEIDLFGRVRRALEAANAQIQVSIEDEHAVQLTLMSDVAQSYIELRGAQLRKATAVENIATLSELLELTQQRRDAGLTSDEDVSRSAAQLDATRSDLPALELQIVEGINALSALLAREPDALRAELETAAPIPAVPESVAIGVPADLARRRPDVREAEASLHVATAQIGVATADLFPRLVLSAQGGLQSQALSQLGEWASRFGSLGPSFQLPIFDRGQWRTVHLDKLRAQESALAYQRTVIQALREVANALAAFNADQDRRVQLDRAVSESRDALALARERYQSGVTNFIDVLDAQRTLQQNESALIDAISATSVDLVALYRALGGGWSDAMDH